jgi:hypothetical protein
MNFTSYSSGSIDFSPNPIVKRITVVLDEPELRHATYDQFERFWDVWHGERKRFAPKLTDFTLVLRPGWENGQMILTGIQRFLDYYHTFVEPACNTRGLHVYTDSYSAAYSGVRYQVQQAPVHLFSVGQPASVSRD